MTIINHLNMLQNKLIRAAANGVCGEAVMINRLLDNGQCFALGYEVMSRLCLLSRGGCIRWRTNMEWKGHGVLAIGVSCKYVWKNQTVWDFSGAVFQIWLKCSDVETQQQKVHSAFHSNQKQQQDQRAPLVLSGLGFNGIFLWKTFSEMCKAIGTNKPTL